MKYTRAYVKKHPELLFIFTDNTDRSSGNNIIDSNSWYSKKYGSNLKYPNVTSAMIRGLDNAYPISTQRWYHTGAKGPAGNWNNQDFEIFKKVIDDEIDDIINAISTRKYKDVVFCSSIINGTISDITITRTPALYDYLVEQMQYIEKMNIFYNKTESSLF